MHAQDSNSAISPTRIIVRSFALRQLRFPAWAATLCTAALLNSCGPSDSGADESVQPGNIDQAEIEPEPEPTSWLAYDSDEIDFGTVFFGSARSHRFPMVIEGEDPLIITAIQRSCGCTEGKLMVIDEQGGESEFVPEQPYEPGTKFELVATLNTVGKMGQQSQNLRIIHEDGRAPKFTMLGNIESYLLADPPGIVLKHVNPLKGASGKTRITSRDAQPFGVEILEKVLPPGEVSVEFDAVNPDADGRANTWDVTLNLLPGISKGDHQYKLIFVTDVENEHAAIIKEEGKFPTHRSDIWAKAEVRSLMDVRPQRLSFGGIIPGRPVSKKVIVRNLDPDFEFKPKEYRLLRPGEGGVVSFIDHCKVKARETEPGVAWEFELTISRPEEDGNFGGVLMILTGHPLEEFIEVDFKGIAADPATDSSASQ